MQRIVISVPCCALGVEVSVYTWSGIERGKIIRLARLYFVCGVNQGNNPLLAIINTRELRHLPQNSLRLAPIVIPPFFHRL